MSSAKLAVVGMAVRVPHARSLEALWDNLVRGVVSIDTWDEADGDAPGALDALLLRHGTTVRAGGLLDDPALFDAEYFGISTLDAELLDPQQRVFLEVAHDALANAAEPVHRRDATAVFAGCAMSSYLQHNLLPRADVVARVGAYPLTLSNEKDFLATRVSYLLGLGGPSLAVQAACSTSLVAIHLAAQSLLAGECDTALAGGVSIRLPQRRGYLYQPDGVLAPDGRCHPFDRRAAGFVPGNGAVAVVLRRLEDALADRDPIRAVLLASAVNNDGAARASFTAPSVQGQVRVLSEALGVAELAPGDVTFVEAHGTATALGDPIELAALEQVYGASDVPCYLGSAKANVGHLDTAAGALGLVKAVLGLEHGVVPPLAGFEAPNPRLGIERTRFRIPTRATPWVGSPRRAAVTSLGLGGTNAHVILEEAPPLTQTVATRTRVFPISARDPEALARRRADVAAQLAATDAVGAARLSYALATGAHAAVRQEGVAGADRPARAVDGVRVLMAFPGGGAQHPAMIRGLAAEHPAFAEELDAAIALFAPLGIVDVRAAVQGDLPDADAALRRPEIGLPALFCVQLALARLLARWKIVPHAVIGHSAGEYVAACVAGILDARDAAVLVATRATEFGRAPAGAMLAVALPADEVAARLTPGSGLELSVINGPRDTVVGGPTAAVTTFAASLPSDVKRRVIPIDVAAHTSLVAPIAAKLEARAQAMRFSPPTLPCVSNVTGTWFTPAELTPAYWGAHLRQTVRFGAGLTTLLADPDAVVLDVGPSQTLAALVERCGAASPATRVVALSPRPETGQPPAAALAQAVGRVWEAGAPVAWDGLFAGEVLHRVAVPPHPMSRRRYWIDPPLASSHAAERSIDDWLYEPTLAPAPPAPPVDQATPWVMLGDGSPLAAALSAALAAAPVTDAASLAEAAGASVAFWVDASDPSEVYHRLAEVARAIGAAGACAPRRLVVITRGRPEDAVAVAAARVIDNELPDLDCQAITIAPGEHDARALPVLVERLRARPRPTHLTVRDGAAWQDAFRRLPAASGAAPPPTGSVWVITGGMGAIGATLARHLAAQVNARVVLVGRTAHDDVAASVRAAGGACEIVVGDVADPGVVRAAFTRARDTFGPVYGVIHAAGVPSGGMLQLRDRASAAAVLAPKVGGVRALGDVMPEGVEVVVLCSALDAVLGTLGQAEHCAANAYLDALAGPHRLRARRVVSIGWYAWRAIGQAARAEVPEALRGWRDQMMSEALSPEEGCRVFDAVLAHDTPHVLVSVADIARLRQTAAEMLARLPVAAARARASTSTVALNTPTERRLAVLWTEVLNAGALGADDDFFALGGHSLAAMQLVTRMRETFGLPVRLQDLLTRPTLAAQAGLVDLLFLEKLDSLSDAEVARLLEEMDAP